ncbi:MAG: iron complex outermembrane receptor protein, partial [Limisphaerales bacterium]
MSRVLLFLLVLFTATGTYAQRGPGGANSGKGYNGPPIGKLSGRVIDSLTLEPMPYTTVAVHLMPNDSLVGGGITDNKGKLYIEDLRPGRFKVRINFLGYKTTERSIQIKPGGGEIADLGIVYLSADARNLKSVEVTAERSYMQVGIDRKVYTISKDLSASGGGAIEAMRNIPSIEVDIDGNIALRGSGNVNVLIDGQPSVLTGLDLAGYLESLPASSLESVEVITNPSARFDPDGTSGLINIILKKNRKKGLSGGISAGLGTRDKYSGSANINYRTKDINLFANYGLMD